jgi:hypothetical protein
VRIAMRNVILAFVLTAALTAQSTASDYYKVKVTRKAQDLYQVDGQSIYIKTRYCYEYSFSQDAIVQIDSTVGYNIVKLMFVSSYGSNNSCDIEKLIS